MDLNYLYHRRGVESFMAENAGCVRSRAAHRAYARAYTGRIISLKRELRGEAA
jgi:hypothetical protein